MAQKISVSEQGQLRDPLMGWHVDEWRMVCLGIGFAIIGFCLAGIISAGRTFVDYPAMTSDAEHPQAMHGQVVQIAFAETGRGENETRGMDLTLLLSSRGREYAIATRGTASVSVNESLEFYWIRHKREAWWAPYDKSDLRKDLLTLA